MNLKPKMSIQEMRIIAIAQGIEPNRVALGLFAKQLGYTTETRQKDGVRTLYYIRKEQ